MRWIALCLLLGGCATSEMSETKGMDALSQRWAPAHSLKVQATYKPEEPPTLTLTWEMKR